ncbi:MAG: hypothetical protein ACREX9_22550 [Gammaproteobacteria bacterium]
MLGAGNDGADRMDGGFGFDIVDYSDHGGVPVTASLDSQANDGATGLDEGDDIDFGVEGITGGSGADLLIGDDGPNRLLGGTGSDPVAVRGAAVTEGPNQLACDPCEVKC